MNAKVETARMSSGRRLRNPLVASLSILAGAALVLGLVVNTYRLSQRLAHERAVAATERARADAAQRRAEVVSKFLMEVFAASPEISSREILDQGLAHMRSDLSAPGRKEYVDAERHYREALAMYDKTLPPDRGFSPAALTIVGRQQLDLGQPHEAEATLELALKLWSTDYGRSSVWYAQARAISGRALAMQRRFAEAETALIESYPLLVRARPGDQLTASARDWIEDLYRDTGRPEQAHAYFEQLRAGEPTVQ